MECEGGCVPFDRRGTKCNLRCLQVNGRLVPIPFPKAERQISSSHVPRVDWMVPANFCVTHHPPGRDLLPLPRRNLVRIDPVHRVFWQNQGTFKVRCNALERTEIRLDSTSHCCNFPRERQNRRKNETPAQILKCLLVSTKLCSNFPHGVVTENTKTLLLHLEHLTSRCVRSTLHR